MDVHQIRLQTHHGNVQPVALQRVDDRAHEHGVHAENQVRLRGANVAHQPLLHQIPHVVGHEIPHLGGLEGRLPDELGPAGDDVVNFGIGNSLPAHENEAVHHVHGEILHALEVLHQRLGNGHVSPTGILGGEEHDFAHLCLPFPSEGGISPTPSST